MRGVFCNNPGSGVLCALMLCLPLLCLSLFCHVAPASGGMMQLNSQLENFRFESTERLEELYTLRGVYIDSANTAATEGVQIFINEVRINVFLVNNVLDLAFLYGLHRDYDEKRVVGEYVSSRLAEILNNLRYNINKINDMAAILARQGQQTLADDFYDYRDKLVDVLDTVTLMNETIAVANDQGS